MAESAEGKERPKSSECEEVFGGPVFEPRLYIQRYFYVKQELAKYNVKHVVDFGSAECKISRFLVQIPTLEKLDLVDLDEGLLEWNKFSIRPLTCDYLEKRELPLDVKVFCGSVTNLDESIIGCDGVSMVELIEHLYPDVLKAAVDMVFGKLRPKVIVITTPNSDYNQLFPNFSGMRHWDHKFEWSREEFQSWCKDICKNHQYYVEFGGIGEPPSGAKHLGCCSQSAVFVRKSNATKHEHSDSISNSYKLITESDYPFTENKMSRDDMVTMEINYQLRQYQNMCTEEYLNLNNCSDHFGKPTIFKQIGFKPDNASNQQEDLTCSKICGNCYNSFKPDSTGSLQKDLTGYEICQNCFSSDLKLNINERLVPVTFLMTRKVRSALQPDELRKFLQSHGYRMSPDCNHVIVTANNDHSDDDCNDDDEHDFNEETLQTGSNGDEISILSVKTRFSLDDAYCESWD
ncbi:small RNA 2'-O-methyltransferase-like isoform X2 [Ruditapes philippinarum]|nr:small RNA 2'-O-methyltransferase-like isoform X2 [Ruditapes philippinarum]XP_060569940.1 small RNA 2'-O-methyltransferase-like isoform X2 [Ruditapes philippinarum]